jgi:dipeptidyl aminopeptidase/acylaminoacyl peptidase
VLHIYHNINHDLYLVDVETGANRLLTPHEGDNRFYPGPWAPDGSGFYLMTDQGRDFAGLAFFRLADGAIDWITTPEWDVVAAAVSQDGRYLAWLVNEDGYGHLYVRDEQTGQVRDYPELPRGAYKTEGALVYSLWFSPTEPLLGFYITTPRRPINIYLLNVESGAWQALTENTPQGIAEADMVEPELVRFTSEDGLAIPAWLYRPPGLAPGERVPVVVSIHGGPEYQELPGYGWDGVYQYLVHRKIGVLAPNIRGSTGYGRTYQTLIYHDWGGAELRDLECGAQYLQSLDWVDAARLGVMGGSYGGFATLSCVSRLPEYWEAAVDIVGPSNLVTFARSVPASWRQRMRRWVGDPDTEAEFLLERSPITYVEQIRAALLVLQGAHDPRVVQAESDQMVTRLRELGRTVEYIVFEDEGHGFAKPKNHLKAMRATTAWLERYLLHEDQS